MRCSIAVLFTCKIVLSRLIGKGGWMCETWNGGTNSKILGGPRQTKMIHVEEGLARGSVWSKDKTMTGVLARCSKKIAAQVCIKYMRCNMCQKRKENWNIMCHLHILPMLYSSTHGCSLSVVTLVLLLVYFLQVKNKPWLPWVCSWNRHRREQ